MVSEGASPGNTQDLQGLTRRHPIGHKAGTAIGRISKQLIYGRNKMPAARIIIGRIGVRGQKEGKNREGELPNQEERNKGCCKDSWVQYIPISPLKVTGAFDGEESHGFFRDFEQNKDRR